MVVNDIIICKYFTIYMCCIVICPIPILSSLLLSKSINSKSLEHSHIELIKQKILKEIHMKDRPKTSLKNHQVIIPQSVLDDDYFEENENGKNEMKFVIVPKANFQKKSQQRYKFEIRDAIYERKQLNGITFSIYISQERKGAGELTLQIRFINHTISKTVPNYYIGWMHFNLHKKIQKLPKQLLIDINYINIINTRLKTKNKKYTPYLTLKMSQQLQPRSKRAIDCTDQVTCCKRPLWVNFTAFDWGDWVISPRGFMANYCGGQCTKYNLANPRMKRPTGVNTESCCMTTKHSKIRLSFIEDCVIYQKVFDNLVTEECGCA